MLDDDAVQQFLERLALLLQAEAVQFDPRNSKTFEFMSRESFWENDALEIIAQLGPEHYQWGPRPDDNGRAGEVWLFFFPYNEMFPPYLSTHLYIKLKIVIDITGDIGLVLSFHEVGTYD